MDRLIELLISWGPLGAFLIAMLDSAGAPLPASVDALLITVAVVNPTSVWVAVLLAVIGSLAGNLLLFSVARKGGVAFLARRTVSARGKRLRGWFQRYGLITVFIPTLVPIAPLPMKVFVISAGALGVKMRAFLLTILVGRIPRYLAMAYLGTQLGENSMEWLRDHAWHLSAIAAGLFVFLLALVKLVDYRRGAMARLG